jgi:signal transduction histidine kinase
MGVMFVQGARGQLLLVNARARQLLGQREDPSAGLEHFPEIYRLHRPDGSVYPWSELPVARALKAGVSSMREDIVVHRPDGRRIPLVAWGAPLRLGETQGHDGAVWVFEDLTALRQAETARLDSEARLRAVIESMAEGLLLQDEQGTVVEWNAAACSILGVAPAEMPQRQGLGPTEDCLRDDGSPFPVAEQPDRVCLRRREPVHNVVMGVPVVGAAGLRWLLVNALPLMLPAPQRGLVLHRVVTTFADITAHRRALSELGRVGRLDLIGRLAGGIIHDFNNLLVIVLGLTQKIRSELPPGPALDRDLQRIEHAAEQAVQLAAQLLAFGKNRQVALGPISLKPVVERTLDLISGSLPLNINLDKDITAADLTVLADEGQLQQVLLNLCLNARDAMPASGRLSVRLAQGAPHAESGTSWACLTVEDTGQGMDAATLAQIFDPFFTTKERGTGLGLAVVKQLVESFAGRIDVWSEPGRGARFTIWLPLLGGDQSSG